MKDIHEHIKKHADDHTKAIHKYSNMPNGILKRTLLMLAINGDCIPILCKTKEL